MKIQAINFKAPIVKTNLSFKDRDVIINKNGTEQDVFICSQSKIDPKKQKEAKKMYAQAKKIHRTWQKQKPFMLVDKNQVTKQYFIQKTSLSPKFYVDALTLYIIQVIASLRN